MINLSRHREPDHDDLYYPRSAKELLIRLHALRPDVVHVHLGGNIFIREAALFFALARRAGVVNVLTFHSGGYPSSSEGKRATPRSFRGLAFRQLDAIIGVNNQLIDVFARYGVRKDRVHMIEPFSRDIDREAINAEGLPPLLADFAAKHSPLLLAVGLLEPEYGLDVQLQAMSAIRREFPNAGLLIVGSGTLHQSLQQKIDEHPESAHVLLAGDVPRPKTLALIARANLLLRTTHFDGDALSVREALALGTRVLATDNGMRPAGVQLLRTLEPDALAQAIGPALKYEPPVAEFSSTKPDPIDQVISLYEQLVTRK